MHTLDWCFVDELEPGDTLATEDETAVEVVALDLIRTPAGPCAWRVRTSGPVMRYEVLDRVQRVAA
jgi:hypothetical protein